MDSITGMSTPPELTDAIPDFRTPSIPPRAPRPGFFSRWTRPSRASTIAASVPVTTATTVAIAVPAATVALLTTPLPSPPISICASIGTPTPASNNQDEVAKLRAENKELSRRCAELSEQSDFNRDALHQCISDSRIEADQLKSELVAAKSGTRNLDRHCKELARKAEINQEILQERVSRCKIDTDNWESERLKLKSANEEYRRHCDELVTQSDFNQDLLQECTKDLVAKDLQITLLKTSANLLRTENSKLTAENASVETLQVRIQQLQAELEVQKSYHMRLESIGFTPVPAAADSDLLVRISTLEHDNVRLQEELTKQKVTSQALALDYDSEKSDLAEQLRIAETDVRLLSKSLDVQENLFLTQHEQCNNLVEELEYERTANAYLELQLRSKEKAKESSSSQPVEDCNALRLQNALLATQLAKTQATASERQSLIDNLTASQQRFVDAVKQEQADQRKTLEQLHTCRCANEADRKRFNDTLIAKDGEIEQLEKRLRTVGMAARSLEAARHSKYEEELEERVEGRLRDMQIRADRAAQEKIEELERQIGAMRFAGCDAAELMEERLKVLAPGGEERNLEGKAKFERRGDGEGGG